ncbi:hypothetical protein ABVT39_011416 [Epinephelus coioides]
MRLAEMPDLSCCAHALQLVVNEHLSSQRVMGDIISKPKTCAMHFNHSVLAKQHLRAIQEDLGLPQHGVIQAVPTRWNSTLHMLQRMVEQKRALSVYAGEYGKFTCPTAEQWVTVSNLIETLSPIEEVTLERGSSEDVTTGRGPTTRGIGTLRQTMLESFERRFHQAKETKCLVRL